MKTEFLVAWNTHCDKNRLLIENISPAGFEKTLSTRGGRTILQQWIHIHNVRLQWLEICAPDIHKKCKPLDKDAPLKKESLSVALQASGKGIEELLDRGWDHEGRIKGFRKGVFQFLAYLVSHESHHRGNMLLTLKQSGEKIPDAVKWGLWEWNK
ncbi:MAG: DinB family protein [Chitinophagaceae bacterium]